MKKTLSFLLVFVMTLSLLVSCGSESSSSADTFAPVETTGNTAADTTEETEAQPTAETVRVFSLKGPTGMGMSKIMNDFEEGLTPLKYSFTLASSPDEVTAEIVKGDFDIAAVPANLASVLYNKVPETVQIAAVNTLGVLYVLENGTTINSIEDLNGKTIYATGQGSTPEYVLSYILKAFEIDCTVEYITEHSELATKMTAGDVAIGMLPVPNATTVLAKNADVRVALDLTELWEKAAEKNGDKGALYQGCIVINKEFAKNHPTDLKMFLEEYDASVKFVNEKPDEASLIIEKFEIVPAAAIAKKAIPDANIVFITGEEMKTGLTGFFKVLFDFNPKSVGGKLPDDGIFYIAE